MDTENIRTWSQLMAAGLMGSPMLPTLLRQAPSERSIR